MSLMSLTRSARAVTLVVMLTSLSVAACTAEAARLTSTVISTPSPRAGVAESSTLPPLEHRLEPAEPAPTPIPTPRPRYESPVESVSAPAARIFRAPLVPMNVRDGYMDLPYNPYQVAWYDFTAKPGMGGNAVFSAHVDYIRYGPAVFANLHRLHAEDEVVIALRDGTQLHYSVVSNETVALGSLDMREVLASGEEDIATLITCGGYFNGYDYSHRIVVVARLTSVITP